MLQDAVWKQKLANWWKHNSGSFVAEDFSLRRRDLHCRGLAWLPSKNAKTLVTSISLFRRSAIIFLNQMLIKFQRSLLFIWGWDVAMCLTKVCLTHAAPVVSVNVPFLERPWGRAVLMLGQTCQKDQNGTFLLFLMPYALNKLMICEKTLNFCSNCSSMQPSVALFQGFGVDCQVFESNTSAECLCAPLQGQCQARWASCFCSATWPMGDGHTFGRHNNC